MKRFKTLCILFAITTIIFIFVSSKTERSPVKTEVSNYFEKSAVTYTYDGCEYVIFRNSHVVHKGNCKNCRK